MVSLDIFLHLVTVKRRKELIDDRSKIFFIHNLRIHTFHHSHLGIRTTYLINDLSALGRSKIAIQQNVIYIFNLLIRHDHHPEITKKTIKLITHHKCSATGTFFIAWRTNRIRIGYNNGRRHHNRRRRKKYFITIKGIHTRNSSICKIYNNLDRVAVKH